MTSDDEDTFEHELPHAGPYGLVVRTPLRYAIVHVGTWGSVLGKIATRRAGNANVENLRVILFSESRRENLDRARQAFQTATPQNLTCPECGSPATAQGTEGDCICLQGHYFWASSTPEWQAFLEPQRSRRHVPLGAGPKS